MAIELKDNPGDLVPQIKALIWGDEGEALPEPLKTKLREAVPLGASIYATLLSYVEIAYAAHALPEYDLPKIFAERLVEAAHIVAKAPIGPDPDRAAAIKVRMIWDLDDEPAAPTPVGDMPANVPTEADIAAAVASGHASDQVAEASAEGGA